MITPDQYFWLLFIQAAVGIPVLAVLFWLVELK